MINAENPSYFIPFCRPSSSSSCLNVTHNSNRIKLSRGGIIFHHLVLLAFFYLVIIAAVCMKYAYLKCSLGRSVSAHLLW